LSVDPLHIGVDATCWLNNRGYGRHARALLRSLLSADPASRYTFFIDSDPSTEPLPPQAAIRRLRAKVPTTQAASAEGHRSLVDMWRTTKALSTSNLDVLLYPTVYSYVPALCRARKIVIIHDVIAETFPQLTVPNTSARLFWNAKVALSRFQADAIVTVSEYSRRHIIERFRVDPSCVFVVGEAADPVFRVIPRPNLPPSLKPLLGRDNRIVTYVGGFSPHKNIRALVSAFFKCSLEFRDARLVMVGEHKKEVFHSYFDTIQKQVRELGIEDRVIFPGYLSDEELAHLLNLSSVLVLPSLMEGFGLPAVEAAACGCPVIATTESPLPDLLGEGAIYIDPNKHQLDYALFRVLESESLRKRMSGHALEAASRLTWDAAAQEMLNVIRHVAAK
jgi:glycosyltransferase involved in cell wall biosynthesis